MRTIPSGISGTLTAVASQPGYLVRIDVKNGPLRIIERLTNLDADFITSNVDGNESITWRSTDVEITGLDWRAESSSGQLTLGDPDMRWWRDALLLNLQDAPVRIWQVYAEAPGEAVMTWMGYIGGIQRDADFTVICELYSASSLTSSPRRRVQSAIDPKYLLPAGKVFIIGGQKWVLTRKSNG